MSFDRIHTFYFLEREIEGRMGKESGAKATVREV
jgi:hypothetical protein